MVNQSYYTVDWYEYDYFVQGSYSPDHHICNHGRDWWFERCPSNTVLGRSGNSLDLETEWLEK